MLTYRADCPASAFNNLSFVVHQTKMQQSLRKHLKIDLSWWTSACDPAQKTEGIESPPLWVTFVLCLDCKLSIQNHTSNNGAQKTL